MSRYVDIDSITEDDKQVHGFFQDFDLMELLEEHIDENAEHIVRCNDCIHGEPEEDGRIRCNVDSYITEYNPPHWFCPNGEKKVTG